jgi:cobalamin biosynthesis protein CobT
VLSDLIEHDNPQVRTYVNGALYSVLNSSPLLRDKAQEMGMEDMLRELTKRSEDAFTKQVAYILNALLSGEDLDDNDQDDNDDDQVQEDYDQDDDDSIEEEDEEETLPGNTVTGEELLCSLFLASNETARQEVKSMTQTTRPDTASLRTGRSGSFRGPNVNFSLDDLMNKTKNVQQEEEDEEDEEDEEEEDEEDEEEDEDEI